LPCDEAGSFQRKHHLVNRRQADAEIFLDVRFGRRSTVQPRIEVDKARYCTCLGVKGFVEGLTPAIRFSCKSLSHETVRRRLAESDLKP
jgi:hypothetical protein